MIASDWGERAVEECLRPPYPWERKMTICIAAVADEAGDKPFIIFCTDWLISGALGQAETVLKSRILHGTWSCLTAANNHSDALAAVALLRKKFRENPKVDETNVTTLIREAMSQRKHDKADEFIQSRWGISYDDFLKNGKSYLSPDLHSATLEDIAGMKLNVELIIAGFSTDGFPILCQVNEFGIPSLQEDFALAGEGKFLAAAALRQRGYIATRPLVECIYCAYEAKRFAEGAPTVGAQTLLLVIARDGEYRHVTQPGFEALKADYERLKPREISDLTFTDQRDLRTY
jgi:hypothetical protein